MREKKVRNPFSTITLPTPLVEEIEMIVEEFRFWPTKTAFVREAAMQKLERYKKELEARRSEEEPKLARR